MGTWQQFLYFPILQVQHGQGLGATEVWGGIVWPAEGLGLHKVLGGQLAQELQLTECVVFLGSLLQGGPTRVDLAND